MKSQSNSNWNPWFTVLIISLAIFLSIPVIFIAWSHQEFKITKTECHNESIMLGWGKVIGQHTDIWNYTINYGNAYSARGMDERELESYPEECREGCVITYPIGTYIKITKKPFNYTYDIQKEIRQNKTICEDKEVDEIKIDCKSSLICSNTNKDECDYLHNAYLVVYASNWTNMTGFETNGCKYSCEVKEGCRSNISKKDLTKDWLNRNCWNFEELKNKWQCGEYHIEVKKIK